MAEKRTSRAEKDAKAVEDAIAEMPDADRTIAERLHRIILDAAPDLAPKLWYKQPAYAKDGKVICFFRGAAVDGERYLSLGFSSDARLDDGAMWPTAYAVTGLTPADEEHIASLVTRASS